jgi:predicted nuclease of predicted toxin-antitoxin system
LAERFLLDENVPSSIIELLRKKRFEARSVIQALGPGTSNGRIAEEAARSGEIIITLDSDFLKLHPNPGTRTLIIDVHPATPSMIGQVLDSHLEHSVQLLKKARRVKLTKSGPVSIDT